MVQKPAILKDIGSLAGVFAAAVSLALHNQFHLKIKKREQIMSVAWKVTFQPDFLAGTIGKTFFRYHRAVNCK